MTDMVEYHDNTTTSIMTYKLQQPHLIIMYHCVSQFSLYRVDNDKKIYFFSSVNDFKVDLFPLMSTLFDKFLVKIAAERYKIT